MKLRRLLFLIPCLLSSVSLFGQENLSFTFEQNEDGLPLITFDWQGEPDLALQRSSNLSEGSWETLLATRGHQAFSEPQQEQVMFYRLVRLPGSGRGDTSTPALEWRLTEMMINQIERALIPQFAKSPGDEEFPPDNGDGVHSLDQLDIVQPFTWATQPGLIRIYQAGKRGFARAFKLYSSKDSVASTAEDLTADVERVLDWKQSPHHFTDLNEPILNLDGTTQFPILDSEARTLGVEGFSYLEDASIGTDDTALPMPAEWLYVLSDGSLGTLNQAGAWEGDGEASDTNPIMARLAYWADDETAKLNVNVASEGNPWDVPRANTAQDRAYALDQPVTGEVQRYPGHPAMTSLSAMLFPGKAAGHPDESKRLTDEELRLIYELTPGVSFRDRSLIDEPLVIDKDRTIKHLDTWIESASKARDAELLQGFITTNNPSPEITVHGHPRISMWPLTERPANRTDYDHASASLSTAGSTAYQFLRNDASSRHAELYTRSDRHNLDLFRYLMRQTYLKTPGYGKPLAAKYGARLEQEDFADDTDYDKDHYVIALAILDRIRTSNLNDPNSVEPYGDPTGPLGIGAVAGMDLIGRDFDFSVGSLEHAENWNKPTLEPHSPGRNYLPSELALVAYVTGESTMIAWNNGEPTFRDTVGTDALVRERILANQHPRYREWTGQSFGPGDVGKTFMSVEFGLLPEFFSVSQGTPRKFPRRTLRLLTGGPAYRGGVSEDRGLRINGIPLQLWGQPEPPNSELGPLISTSANTVLSSPNDLPRSWQSTGGAGGSRLFRFGLFTIDEDQEGWFGSDFLPNGRGPLSHWYCQTPIIIEQGSPLTFTQEEPLQIVVYDGGVERASTQHIERLLHFRFAQPGEALEVPGPERGNLSYAGWTRRLRTAASGPVSSGPIPITDPSSSETIKGLAVSHGDHRHIALKRAIPSELFTHHINVTSDRASHSLTWAVPNGTSIEPTALQGDVRHGRSLIEGVDYDQEVLPDFVQAPLRRTQFAPLLGENYHFPIDPTITRDFDNGLGNAVDGPYLNSSDEGESTLPGSSVFNQLTPYFDGQVTPQDLLEHEHYFPRRIAPSPVAFGSLPSASQANAPWTCLLFRPNVSEAPHLGEPGNAMVWESNRTTLEGFQVPQMASVTDDPTYPADHLWLDYFWMPTAEPSHVSSPFATQGKVNMNYQLFPYTYIKRATAMHAVLKSEEVMAIPTNAGPSYKTSTINPNWRHRIDSAQTLAQFEETFDRGEIFITESEICEQFLIPEGETWDGSGENIRAFWDAHRLSGDNTLERPYAGLYSRLTTRSNAFRLHYRIQAITKGADSPPNRFDPDQDTIAEDHRDSKVIERVLRHKELPDYTEPNTELSAKPRIETFYDVIVRE